MLVSAWGTWQTAFLFLFFHLCFSLPKCSDISYAVLSFFPVRTHAKWLWSGLDVAYYLTCSKGDARVLEFCSGNSGLREKKTFILHLHIIEYTPWSTRIVFRLRLRNQRHTCKSKGIVFLFLDAAVLLCFFFVLFCFWTARRLVLLFSLWVLVKFRWAETCIHTEAVQM